MKLFFKIVLVLLLVLFGVGLFLATRVSPETLAANLQKVLNETLEGGRLSIGSIEASLFPKPKCELHDLAFVIDGTETPLLKADGVRFGATWSDLLAGNIVFEQLGIDRPVVRWTEDKATASFLEKYTQKKQGNEHQKEPPVRFAIKTFQLKDGSVTLRRPETNATLAFDEIGINMAYGGKALLEETSVRFVHGGIPWILKIPSVKQKGAKLEMDEAVLSVGDTKAKIDLEAENADIPRIKTKIAVGNVDEKLLQALQQSAAAAKALFPGDENRTKLDKTELPNVDLTAEVSLESFEYNKVAMQACTAEMQSRPERAVFRGRCQDVSGLKNPTIEVGIRPDQNRSFEGSLFVGTSSPREIIEHLGVAEVNASSPLLKRFEATAAFEGDSEGVTVRDAFVNLDNTEAAFKLKALNGDVPVIVFDLAVDRLDVDAYRKALLPSRTAEPETAPSASPALPEKKPRIGGQIRFETLKVAGYDIGSLQANLKYKDDLVILDPLGLTLFDGRFEGRYQADFASYIPTFHIEHTIRGLDLQKLNAHQGVDQKVSGRVDVTLRLDVTGRTPETLIKTAKGHAILDGHDVRLYGVNIDQMINAYKTAKYLQFADMVLLFTTGPLGGLVSVGTRAAITAAGATPGGSTEFSRIHSLWQIEDGSATAMDVAAKTRDNRIAMTGAINMVEKRFDDVRIAVIDRKGCAMVEQHITGPFKAMNPDYVEASGDFMAGSIKEVLDFGNQIVDECPVFYRGQVK